MKCVLLEDQIYEVFSFISRKGNVMFIVVPCILFQSLLYCSNSCTSLHFETLKSHTKTLKILHYMYDLL